MEVEKCPKPACVFTVDHTNPHIEVPPGAPSLELRLIRLGIFSFNKLDPPRSAEAQYILLLKWKILFPANHPCSRPQTKSSG